MKKILTIALLANLLPLMVFAKCNCICYDTPDRQKPSSPVVMADKTACYNGCANGNLGKNVYYDCNEFADNVGAILGGTGSGAIPNAEAKYISGEYEVNDFLRVGVNLTKIILGLVGSVALLAFVYGGFMWLISAGDPGRVKKGKDAVTAAVIGMVIVFTSYLLVRFILTDLMGYNWQGTSAFSTAAQK